jgi:hypothetical protein
MRTFSSEYLTARRPDVFRALGPAEPPAMLRAGEADFRLLKCLKHDSWAATALYADAAGRRLACKFNRWHPLPGGLPTEGLGTWLAEREAAVLREMSDRSGFPRWVGAVSAGADPLPNAVAHWWIEGRPFRPDLMVNDDFFPQLSRMLSAFHATGRAYVDMSKWGNILLGDDGKPSLLDYQIHYRAGRGRAARWLLRQLQMGDWFYLRRHWRRCRPDQYAREAARSWSSEPPHIWLAERVGFFFRGLRIAILRCHGVKGDPRRNDEAACASGRGSVASP